MIIKFLKHLLNNLSSFFKDHTWETLLSALGIGATAAAIGSVESKQAKKVNQQALSIQKEALSKYEDDYDKTICILNQLGNSKKRAIDSFQRFSDLMEKIRERPEFKTVGFLSVKLPDYQPKEIRKMSEDIQMIFTGAGGTIVGVLGGLAAFGVTAIAAAPGLITGGLVLCVKGCALKKKAIENVRQAKELKKSVEKISSFYTELQTVADSVRCLLDTDFLIYDNYLNRVDEIIRQKAEWKDFTPSERKLVENTVILARLLYAACKVPLILKKEDADQLETINYKELKKLKRQEKSILHRMKKESNHKVTSAISSKPPII